MVDKYIDVIENSSLFKNIKKNDLNCLLKCLAPQIYDYGKNECIVNAGETVDKFGLILDGEAIIMKENSEGNRVILSVAKKGDLFGEMLVFSSKKLWPATVRVENHCKVLLLTNSDIVTRCSNMCPWHTSMLNNFVRVISDKALRLNKKVEYLSIKSIRGKICAYLIDQYENKSVDGNNIVIPLNRNELADFLNVSRPSMSREMCKLRDEGIIDFHLSTFKIKDVDALRDNLI